MTTAHLASLAVHISAGSIALGLGTAILWRPKGTRDHRALGRWFGYATAVVCLSAAVGLLWFRFLPTFAVLTVHVGYQLAGGWRAAITRERGPAAIDAWLTVAAMALGGVAIWTALGHDADGRAVTIASFGALATVLTYDVARWRWPARWHRVLWRYEHIYKLVGSLFGLLSALVGNVVRVWQPWSQLLPTVLGIVIIGWYWVTEWRRTRGRHLVEVSALPI